MTYVVSQAGNVTMLRSWTTELIKMLSPQTQIIAALNRQVFLGLPILCILVGVYANAVEPGPSDVRKIDFERRSGILVWDSGTRLEFVDSEDEFSDSNSRCVSIGRFEGLRYDEAIKRYNDSPNELPINIDVINRTHLDIATLKSLVARTVKTYESQNPNRPLFILFPETHHKGGYTVADDPNGHAVELHRSQANIMFDLMRGMTSKGISLYNFMEGPHRALRNSQTTFDWQKSYERFKQGVISLNDPAWDWQPRSENYIKGLIYNEANRQNGSMAMAEFFPGVPSFAVEDLSLYLDGAMKVRAYFNPEPSPNDRAELSSFENTIYPFRGFNAINEDENRLNEVRERYKNLTDQERADVVNKSCEGRSRNMVENALKLSQEPKAIIFLRFGSLHSRSVMDSIKANSSSYILISP
jgi:hypothetical protein